ncbi:MAG: MarR family transcriptional regulator [Candidatus Thorarchaeota archaeon]|nr:MarR family transcriptional regulator [Candidatus Thorarchaeota archaeon]
MQRISFFLLSFVVLSLIIIPTNCVSEPAQTSDILLDPIDIIAVMDNDGLTTVSIRARMVNLGGTSVTELNFRIDSLAAILTLARVNQTSASTLIVERDRYTEVVIDLGLTLDPNESVWIDLGFLASDFQSESVVGADITKLVGDFIYYIRPLTGLANLTFTAVLPTGAMLSQESLDPLFPNTDLNYTDGSSLSFMWYTASLQPGQEKAFIIMYQTPNYEANQIESFVVESIIIAFLGIAVGIGIAVFGPRILYRLRQIGKIRFIGVTSEEEEVLEVIRRKGGSCPQKDLYTEFEMSQAKVSLLLNNLEERGLVRRFREGRENVVHIMED